MKTSEILRAAAVRMRDGFTPEYDDANGCGCFLERTRMAIGCSYSDTKLDMARDIVAQVVGFHNHFPLHDAFALVDAGWTGPECTDDAVAALEIAADIAVEAERAETKRGHYLRAL